ncbi:DNA polymerase III subunit gamma/tau [Microbacterium sp. LRZ72]|uniref:DNA polymerase III subunit gamma/tau n=1 Tax=Microbacterium sp. LRZ72 TaxID=2942481 RepID=UPI0029A4B9B0|nr:DNA polymerase III subunit gamma/tau [Microbacterium sp. LRZ72]MDX2375653.1 DNA polymerase III subunit gamma/tau [Microbacterium sp. LRZ72]
MAGRDDDALSWGGDDDPTLASSGERTRDAPSPREDPALAEGWTAVGTPRHAEPQADTAEAPPATAADGDEPEPEPADGEAASSAGNATLIGVGVLGGIYLLYAIGWLIGGLRLQGRYQVLVTDAMYQGALWFATAAPLIWFGAVLVLARRSAGWVRWLGLIAGALLLIPWPFIMIGAVGA